MLEALHSLELGRGVLNTRLERERESAGRSGSNRTEQDRMMPTSIVKVVDVDAVDGIGRRQLVGEQRPAAQGRRRMGVAAGSISRLAAVAAAAADAASARGYGLCGRLRRQRLLRGPGGSRIGYRRRQGHGSKTERRERGNACRGASGDDAPHLGCSALWASRSLAACRFLAWD